VLITMICRGSSYL